MTTQKENLFRKAADSRKTEQQEIRQVISNSKAPEHDEKQSSITFFLSDNLKQKLKLYAVQHRVSVSDLLRDMIQEKVTTRDDE